MQNLAAALVERVDDVWRRLRMISESQASLRPAVDEWSKKEIVGHLIDSAANNHHRFIRAQQTAELAFPAYEQTVWVKLQAYNHCPWQPLIDFWRLYNLHLAHTIERIPDDKLDTVCKIGENAPVTLKFLVEDYLTHLNLHVRQLGF